MSPRIISFTTVFTVVVLHNASNEPMKTVPSSHDERIVQETEIVSRLSPNSKTQSQMQGVIMSREPRAGAVNGLLLFYKNGVDYDSVYEKLAYFDLVVSI